MSRKSLSSSLMNHPTPLLSSSTFCLLFYIKEQLASYYSSGSKCQSKNHLKMKWLCWLGIVKDVRTIFEELDRDFVVADLASRIG